MDSNIAIGNTTVNQASLHDLKVSRGGRDKEKITTAKENTAEKRALKEACREFEGLLLGIILKEGLKREPIDEEQTTDGGDIFQEYAAEQAARDMGQNESFGIARMMYEQLSGEKHNAR
jgi:Rod binding domain-containing protein